VTGPAGFQDYSGNSGFTSNGEGAEATLNVTMSDDSARNLWDVQAAIQQIAADFQTAVRAASDFNSYLISIRETSQTVKMPGLGMEGGAGGNMEYAGGRVDTSSVPGGGIAAFGGEMSQAERVGEMLENQDGAGGGAMASRNPNARPVDPGEFVGQMTNAAWMASMTGQHGGVPQETQSAYEREYDFALNNRRNPAVRRAQFQGQQGTARAYAASQLVRNNLPAAQQFLRGGGAGGIASMLGRLGTYGAIGYAGYELVNAGLETYAQSRAMAISTNNSQLGTGWGFEQRLGQAGMALSPFVTQEEAAQIYSSAIDQGWASRQGGFAQGSFGQAVNFMYGAAKDYNMDPAMAAQLLQTNSLGAGESVQALSEQLLTLKQTLDGTGVSTDAANSAFTSLTGQLIASGSSGPTAALVAGGALSAYSGDTYLMNGRGAQIFGQTIGGQQGQNILAGLTGTVPGAAMADSHILASTAELDRLNKRFADQVMGMRNLDPDEQAAMFAQLYNSTWGTSITTQDASHLIATSASNPNALSSGQKKYLEQQKISYKSGDQSKGAWDRYTGYIQDQASGAWYHKFTYANSWLTGLGSLFGSGDTENSVRNYSPEVQNLLDNSIDSGKVQVLDDKGNVVATGKDDISKWFNDQNNYQKFSATGSKYTIKDNGATWNATNIGGAANAEESGNPGNAKNTVYITLSAQAKQYFDTDKTSVPMSDGKN
jgi:hypothetical protein